MGFWSGFCLVRPKGFLGGYRKNEILEIIQSSDFFHTCINGKYEKSGCLISLGGINPEFCESVVREPCVRNSEPFVPCGLSFQSGRFEHSHLQEHFMVTASVISFSGMGYPFPWGISDVKERFDALPYFNELVDTLTAQVPASGKLSNAKISHAVYKEWCKPIGAYSRPKIVRDTRRGPLQLPHGLNK
jgi:hypothetical protein